MFKNLKRFFDSFTKKGPLLSLISVCRYMQNHYNNIPGCKKIFSTLEIYIRKFQFSLDKKFDKRYGVETSGIIPVKSLSGNTINIQFANWYEPTSVKTFNQILDNLIINFEEFTFIDFGSGKGRVLLLASRYAFKKIIGVEFDKYLHQTALETIIVYNTRTNTSMNIESIYTDATTFTIPDGKLVLFFFSPFKEKVMSTVLANNSETYSLNRNKMFIIIYGTNEKSIELINSMKFHCVEINLRPDWAKVSD